MLEQEDFFTKDDESIEFKIDEEQPSDSKNRGWVLHTIKAYLDGEEVGYLKVSYIPRENMDRDYANIVQYMDRVGGRSFHVNKPEYKRKNLEDGWDYLSDRLDSMPLEDQVLGLDKITGYPYEFDGGQTEEKLKSMTEQDLLDLKERFLGALHSTFGKDYEEFKDYFTDNPVVDYIRVKESVRRKRIGAALYETGARWLAKKGLKLFASQTQSPRAKATWMWLAKNKKANIGQEKMGKWTRTYLSYL